MTSSPTDIRGREKTTYTIDRTDSDTPSKDPLVPQALVGKRRPWTAWQDWVNVGLGAYLVLAPRWIADAPIGWFVTLGILAIAVGLWAGSTASSSVAEWSQMIVGVVTILSPLFGRYGAALSATWTAWIIGLALLVFAATAMHQNRSGRSHTNPYDNAQA